MRFLARLSPELIRIAPPWRTFSDTVTGLVGALADERQLPRGCTSAAVRAIEVREAEASTALLDISVGVPHARLPELSRSAVAVAASPPGLYEAVPMVSIQIVALVLSPRDNAADHLETLAGIATLLRSTDLRAALLRARDGSEALAALRAHARVMP
jgi:mannitol/fructose-specific phosphotransferase system IIA component (Ntr-type)